MSEMAPRAPRSSICRALRTPRGAALLFGALALTQAGVGLGLTATSSSSVPGITLTGDADGTALFTASGMAPGHTLTRCLRLSYGNAVSGDQLKLMGSSSGALAEHMQVRIEAGTGGSAATCAGFTGSVVYTGTLSGLTSAHGTAATALPLKTLPDGDAAVTVRMRIAIEDTNIAQGLTASSDLVWVADALGNRTAPPPVVTPVNPTPVRPPATTPPVVDPPVDPVPDAPVDPAPADPSADIPSGTDGVPPASTPTATTTTPAPDAGSTTPAPSAAEPGSGRNPSAAPTSVPVPPSTGGGDDAGGLGRVGHVFSSGAKALSSGARTLAHAVTSQVIAPVAAAAAPAVRGASLGLGGTAPLLGAFLLIQGRIDRRDPKLALAPAYADPDLTFNDIPRGPLKSRSTTVEPEPGTTA